MSQLPLDWSPGGPERTPPLSVTELGTRIAAALAGGLPDPVRVAGEIGSFSERSGHWYFNLKDEKALMQCVCWASDARRVRHRPEAGDAVEVSGSVVHWLPQGRTQLRVRAIELAGEGEQQAAFRRLCEELRVLGWFAEEAKQALPRYPRRIAVLTSAAGAALHDVRATAAGRWPACELVLVDVPVQGAGAAARIAAAIASTDASAEAAGIEAIILTRGGGSAEDLQAFNERSVAAAIQAASTPIVAAIGHESDTSIAELVADRRASTPTQAAMLLLPDRVDEAQRLDLLSGSLVMRVGQLVRSRSESLSRVDRAAMTGLRHRIDRARQRLLRAEAALLARRPHALLGARRRLVDGMAARAREAVTARRERGARALGLIQIHTVMRRTLARAEARLDERRGVLEAVGPEAVLARGYSVTTDAAGRVIRDGREVGVGAEILSRLAVGAIRSTVTEAGGD
jgi:exodeoxyribonuclease VII large subunit